MPTESGKVLVAARCGLAAHVDLALCELAQVLDRHVARFSRLLEEVGFSATDVFFKWYNFCGILGVK